MRKKNSHPNLTDIGLSKSIKFTIPKHKKKQEQETKAKQRKEDCLQSVDEKRDEQKAIMSALKKEIFQIIEAEYKRQVDKEEGLQQQKVQKIIESKVLIRQFDDSKIRKNFGQSRKKDNKILSGNRYIGGQQKDIFNRLNKSKIHSSKLIQNESLMSSSLQKSRYNLNEQKYVKINDNKHEIFRARPKLRSTPALLDTYQLGEKSKTYELEPQRPKQKKVKFKTELCQKKAVNYEIQLPRMPQRPRVLYTESSKTVDVLGDAKNTNKLKSLLSKQLGCQYQPSSLANSRIISGGGQTKMLRLHRINYMKTQE